MKRFRVTSITALVLLTTTLTGCGNITGSNDPVIANAKKLVSEIPEEPTEAVEAPVKIHKTVASSWSTDMAVHRNDFLSNSDYMDLLSEDALRDYTLYILQSKYGEPFEVASDYIPPDGEEVEYFGSLTDENDKITSLDVNLYARSINNPDYIVKVYADSDGYVEDDYYCHLYNDELLAYYSKQLSNTTFPEEPKLGICKLQTDECYNNYLDYINNGVATSNIICVVPEGLTNEEYLTKFNEWIESCKLISNNISWVLSMQLPPNELLPDCDRTLCQISSYETSLDDKSQEVILEEINSALSFDNAMLNYAKETQAENK